MSPSKCASCMLYDGPMRGAGDVVAALIAKTGITRAMQVNPSCGGCAQRRAALNAALPFADKGKQES